MDHVNEVIIQSIIDKATNVCPNSLALIGVYGSVATADTHEKSDLDLLILIDDDEGWKLGTGFILEDRNVGYDLYCTTWDGLKYDAECHHAQLSKLMDSEIVYVNKQEAYDRFLELRAQTKKRLESEERFQRAQEALDNAKVAFANACLCEGLGQVRVEACKALFSLLDAVMLFHGTYFKRGVKRTFEELAALPLDAVFVQTILRVVISKEVSELRECLKQLILYTQNHIQVENKKAPSAALSGTYEEMFSNWRNKVDEAWKNDDRFASFMNMSSLHLMLSDISAEVDIEDFPVMEDYDPEHLEANVRTFDAYLKQYEHVYTRAGIQVKRYADVHEFTENY